MKIFCLHFWKNRSNLFREKREIFLEQGEIKESFDALQSVAEITKDNLEKLKTQLEWFDLDVDKVADLDFKINLLDAEEKTLFDLVNKRFVNYQQKLEQFETGSFNEQQLKLYTKTVELIHALQRDLKEY